MLVLVLLVTHGFRGSSGKPLPPPVIAAAGQLVPYGEAIRARNTELQGCLARHDDALPAGVQIVLRVGADGHPRQVSFTPDQVERSALGGCLRDVLAATVFPIGETERDIALGVHR